LCCERKAGIEAGKAPGRGFIEVDRAVLLTATGYGVEL